MKRIIRHPAELGALARDVLAHFSKDKKEHALLIGLSGELGAGKTAFVQHAARELGIEASVASPTFVIEKIYPIEGNPKFDRLVHIDAYRLEKGSELLALGWVESYKDPRNLILLEWPERVRDILPPDCPIVKFAALENAVREVIW
jgi:tRNA threonylcarbamoyladenosine biosynthesis protein TsaE